MKKLLLLAFVFPVMAQASAYRTTNAGHRLTVNALQSGRTCQKVYLDTTDGVNFEVVGNEHRDFKTCQNMSDGQYAANELQIQVIGIEGEVNPWFRPTCDAEINLSGIEVGDGGTLTNVYCNQRSWNNRRRLINAGRHAELDLTFQQARDQIHILDKKYGAFKDTGVPINYDIYTSASDMSNTKKECN